MFSVFFSSWIYWTGWRYPARWSTNQIARKQGRMSSHLIMQFLYISSHSRVMQVSISSITIPRDKPPGHDLKGAKPLLLGQSLCTKILPSEQNRESKAPSSGHKVKTFHKYIYQLWHYLKWEALYLNLNFIWRTLHSTESLWTQQINGFSMRRLIQWRIQTGSQGFWNPVKMYKF